MGLGSWINRKRHNRGFGIQSPSTFFFITQVLKEKLPYYAYGTIEDFAQTCNDMSAERAKELFRITNYMQPSSCIAVNSPIAACAMAAARPTAASCHITDGGSTPGTVAAKLAAMGCKAIDGKAAELVAQHTTGNGEPSMLFIGYCNNRTEILETALKHAHENSVIIIDGIHRSKQDKEWWEETIKNPATIVTFDMYSYGILLFNKERYKQNYTLKR